MPTDVSDYVENHTTKDYFSLDEIKELESIIAKSLKTINSVKVKKNVKFKAASKI